MELTKLPSPLRASVGGAFHAASALAWFALGVWGSVLCVAIMHHAAGLSGVILGLVVLPATFLAAAWYAATEYGNWFPLTVCYGGGVTATLVWAIGSASCGD